MITAYGERNPGAPAELDLFSFLIGKWAGTGRTRLPDGNHVDWEGATWIGRSADEGRTWDPVLIEMTMTRPA